MMMMMMTLGNGSWWLQAAVSTGDGQTRIGYACFQPLKTPRKRIRADNAILSPT